jgi:thiol-disulfide isomerase/thioredoxin
MRTTSRILVGAILLAPVTLIAEEKTAGSKEPDQPAFQITGRVVDEAGQPVVAVEVQAAGGRSGKSEPTLTNEGGKFSLTLARAPSQYLNLWAKTNDKTVQGFASYPIRERIALPPEFELVARPARTIDVTVVDVDDRPIAEARVSVHGSWYPTTAEGTTDEGGTSRLLVPADAVLSGVAASKPGAGFDYVRYRSPRDPASDPYRLPRDHAQPIRLVLNGSRQVTVRVVDEDGRPMRGVSVRPWYVEKPKKGGTFGMEGLDLVTDEHGTAIVNAIPIDHIQTITFWTEADGYYAPERATLKPGNDAAEITVKLVKLVRIHGRVTFDDGRPAAGAEVKAAADGYAEERFHGETLTDADGRFEFGVYPNQFYAFAASLDRWATPLATLVLRDAPPEDDLRLVLQKGTRVFGKATVGPDRRPVGGQYVMLGRNARDAYTKLPEEERLVATDRHIIQPALSWSTETDDKGAFEFFAGPGFCYLHSSPPGLPEPTFTISDEPELEVNLHAERPSQEEFSGRVVLKDRPQEGVAETTVRGYSLEMRVPIRLEVTTGADGRFKVSRRTVNTLLYARNEGGTLAGIVRIGPDDRSAEIPIAATAFAHGRLIDQATGEPVANMEVTYGVDWPGPHTGYECGGRVRTDDRGEFTAVALVPGWKYHFVAIREHIASGALTGGHWATLTSATPDDPGLIYLGDLKFDPKGPATEQEAFRPVTAPKRCMGRAQFGPQAPNIAAAEVPKKPPPLYDTKADGNEQIAAALKTARTENKHVLLQFGANWCEWCHKLHRCLQEDEEVAASLRENFVLVLIDVDRVDDKKHNADVVERYGNPTQHGLPVLVVLDAEGKLLKTKDTDELEDDGHHDPKKVVAFLNRWKP